MAPPCSAPSCAQAGCQPGAPHAQSTTRYGQPSHVCVIRGSTRINILELVAVLGVEGRDTSYRVAVML